MLTPARGRQCPASRAVDECIICQWEPYWTRTLPHFAEPAWPLNAFIACLRLPVLFAAA